MDSREKKSIEIPSIGRAVLLGTIALMMISAMSGVAMAEFGHVDDCSNVEASGDDSYESDADKQQACQNWQVTNTFDQIADFIVVIVVAVAVPNAAYGFLEWMTANDSVEKDERGRKRIRNTFIALGGVAVFRVGIEAFKLFIPSL